MTNISIFVAAVAVILLVMFVEFVSAVLPIVIVLATVPPEDRHALAELLAAADSSAKLRLWSALKVAVAARRRQRCGH